MSLKFDEYYTLTYTPTIPRKQLQRSSSSSSSEGTAPPPAWRKNFVEKTKMLFTHMSRRWNPRTSEWTLWTLRDPLLSQICSPKLSSSMNRIQESKAHFLESLYKSLVSVCSEFERISSANAIVMKSKMSPVYSSDDIFSYGGSFFYSALSDTISIDVVEIGFEVNGKKENKMVPGKVTLRACGGLAHILATSIKPDDVFIIVGRSVRINKDHYEVPLNVVTDSNDGSEPLILIRLDFDVFDPNVRFMEKIRPYANPDCFVFKYACMNISSKYWHEMVKYRHFSLADGADPAESLFEMPLKRDAILTQVYEKLLANFANFGGNNQQRRSSSSSSSASSQGYCTSPPTSSSDNLELSPRDDPSPYNQRRRSVRFSENVQQYSADEEEDEDAFVQSSRRSSGSRNHHHRRRRSIWITLLKWFLCIVFPFLVLLICTIMFKPVQPICPCTDRDIPPVSPMIQDYGPYHNNYEDVQVLHNNYDY